MKWGQGSFVAWDLAAPSRERLAQQFCSTPGHYKNSQDCGHKSGHRKKPPRLGVNLEPQDRQSHWLVVVVGLKRYSLPLDFSYNGQWDQNVAQSGGRGEPEGWVQDMEEQADPS